MPPTTTFPAPVFAALTPAPFLHAHLTQSPPTRPSTRSPSTVRTPVLNTSSLTHAHGSAVVRAGDTAIVVGVRAEVIGVDDVPLNSTTTTPSTGDGVASGSTKRAHELMEMLVVPNVEFATGCSPDQIPGAAPSALAQSTAFQLKGFLLSLDVVDPVQLEIWGVRHLDPDADADAMDDDDDSSSSGSSSDEDSKGKKEIVGYFVLYIDCIILSLAGTPFPPLWLAVLAALRATTLPAAAYSQDLETVVCHPSRAMARLLRTNGVPIACGYRVFEPALHKGLKAHKDRVFVLADADAFEEAVCREEVLVVVDCSSSDSDDAMKQDDEADESNMRIRRIQKRGGFVVNETIMSDVLVMARRQWAEWNGILCDL